MLHVALPAGATNGITFASHMLRRLPGLRRCVPGGGQEAKDAGPDPDLPAVLDLLRRSGHAH
jgi:hypothetical protein